MILVKWTAFLVAAWLTVVLALALAGCTPTVEYRAIPAWLIPTKPVVDTIPAPKLECLDVEVYAKLAERDRACWQYARELRALLGPDSERSIKIK